MTATLCASSHPLAPRREPWLLSTLAGVQFTHILDFMIMMPLGPRLTRLFSISDAQFRLLVSAYTLSDGVCGLLASTYIDRFGRKRLLVALQQRPEWGPAPSTQPLCALFGPVPPGRA